MSEEKYNISLRQDYPSCEWITGWGNVEQWSKMGCDHLCNGSIAYFLPNENVWVCKECYEKRKDEP